VASDEQGSEGWAIAEGGFEISNADERQMSYADAGFSYGDHGAGFEVLTTLFQHADQKIRELFGLQPLDADANHGGPRRARQGQRGMKIRLQGNDDLRMGPNAVRPYSRPGQGQLRPYGQLSGPRRASAVWFGRG